MIETLLVALIFVSCLYWMAAVALALDFFRIGPHDDREFTPPVSVLKAVKGVDSGAYKNFASFCRQDYPEYELLFGVANASDPVIPIIERLKRDFPEREIRLYVTQPGGANRKASLLHHLAAHARHELYVASDSDMRVTPGYLRSVVQPLADPNVGLVTCPYVGGEAHNLTAGLEALHMGVTFLLSILVARKVLGMRFAIGASIALRRNDLARIGGFLGLSEYLVDDYQVGARIARLGLKVQLSSYILRCVLRETQFRDQWERELRWMRCVRVSRPREYPGLLISFTTPLALVLTSVAGFTPESLRILALTVMVRWLAAWAISGRTGDRESRRWLAWLPVRDILSAITWCGGLFGRRIVWRGEAFLLQPDGRMQPAPAGVEGRRHGRLHWLPHRFGPR